MKDIHKRMKYDIHGSFLDGAGEYKIPKSRVRKIFSESELKRMCGPEAEEIHRGDCMKFWAEEAAVYSQGISI